MIALLSVAAVALQATPAAAPRQRLDDRPWRVELEGGALWSSRNDVQVPGNTGTRFSLLDLTGEGAWPVGRITVEWDVAEKHGLRLLYAPIRTDGTGTLGQPTSFDGVNFATGQATGKYRFDTYRLAYRYRFWSNEHWNWRVGLTGLIRAASIEVSLGNLSARKTNVGFVPLISLTGTWRFAARWSALLDVEGAAASQGRAFDVALKLGYDVNERSRLSFGYRTIEGGADGDEVFSFAWLHAAVVSFTYGF